MIRFWKCSCNRNDTTNPLRAFNFLNRFFLAIVLFSLRKWTTFHLNEYFLLATIRKSQHRKGSCNSINERCQSFVIMNSKQLSYLSQFPFFGPHANERCRMEKSDLTTWNAFSLNVPIFILVYFDQDFYFFLCWHQLNYSSVLLNRISRSKERCILFFKKVLFLCT